MLKLARIGEPVLSPDGMQVAFTVQTVDLEKNSKPAQIYSVPVQGGSPRQLTTEGTSNDRPRWSPDSKQIYFVSNRGGSSQVWVMNADGSGARTVTKVAAEAGGILISADGRKIVFLSSVYPECGADDACNQRKIEEESKSKLKARVYTSLLYRHWTEWQGARRQHLMAMNADGSEIKDLTPGPNQVPPFSLGGQDDYAISPDSAEVAFSMNVDADAANSTNSDIYAVPIAGGDVKKITTGPGADSTPLYSPDGKLLAFRSQARAARSSTIRRAPDMKAIAGA
jgi:Tol biopolymer transport system component